MALVKIISGRVNSGKTTLAASIAEKLRKKGLRTAGYLSVSDNQAKTLYHMQDIAGGEKIPAVSETCYPEGGWRNFGFSRFYFSDEAFKWVDRLIGEILSKGEDERPEVVFIDEIGKLELKGGGCIKAVKKLTEEFDGTVYLVIREDFIDEICEVLGITVCETEILRPSHAQ